MRAAWAWVLGVFGAAAGVAGAVSACGQTSSGCADTQTCTADGSVEGGSGDAPADQVVVVVEGGGDGGAGDGSDAATCNGGDPSVAPCTISEGYGVFVSPTGSDTPDSGTPGTRAMPFATIGQGIVAAKAAGKRVYVCAGTYPEPVSIDATRDGVSVFGGFSCDSWSYAATGNTVTVAPTTRGPALTVKGLTTGVTIEDVAFVAMSGQAPGESSVAVFVSQAQNVVFRRVGMTAGDGVAGAPGASGAAMSNYNVSLAQSDPKIAGKAANGQAPGDTQLCSGLCASGIASVGGQGGLGSQANPGSGMDGGPPIPPNPPGQTPKHDGAGGAAGCVAGDPGANAADAPTGGAGATVLGSLTTSGWTSADGQSGTPGGPGQGGGGGGGGIDPSNGGGGGGGCGGCGGSGGGGGKGGGSSFALLSFTSTITLDTCALKAGNGKDGGAGGGGQVGQSGGYGGAAPGAGCKGGQGGSGGAGSGGGGGSGGVSIAIGYSGTAPTQTGGTLTVGQAGKGGAGGGSGDDAGTRGLGQSGLDGVATETHSF